MVIHPWAWGILALVAIGLVVIDFLGHARNPHPPTAVEAARWTLFYAGLAGLFGVGIWLTNGWLYAQEFYAGWAMEWSLSVDNLFVFILILKAFRVPRENQQKALLLGIVIALLLRLVFILLGAALVSRFSRGGATKTRNTTRVVSSARFGVFSRSPTASLATACSSATAGAPTSRRCSSLSWPSARRT